MGHMTLRTDGIVLKIIICVQDIDQEMALVVNSSAWLEKRGWEAVRDVYKRACLVHCQKRAVIRYVKLSIFKFTSSEIDSRIN